MSAVRALVNALATHTGAQWIGTGGGCMAVKVRFGDMIAPDVSRYEILITDREDVFSRDDWHSNDDVSGFHALLYVHGPDGEYDPSYNEGNPVVVYRTSDDAGECYAVAGDGVPCVDLRAEVDRCAVAVENAVEMVLRAERDGRQVEDTDSLKPEVVRVKRTNGVEGLFQGVNDGDRGDTCACRPGGAHRSCDDRARAMQHACYVGP